jgi:transcriptional regulator with XRE-family HTH domain
MLTQTQVKMARVALGWTVHDLAREAGVNPNTVKRFESGGNVTLATVEKIKTALEKVGITFIPANGGPATIRPPRSTGA